MEEFITSTIETTTATVAPVSYKDGEIIAGAPLVVTVDGSATDGEIFKLARKVEKTDNFVITNKQVVKGTYRVRLVDFLEIAEKIDTEEN